MIRALLYPCIPGVFDREDKIRKNVINPEANSCAINMLSASETGTRSVENHSRESQTRLSITSVSVW